MEDRGIAEEKEEPAAAVGVEEQSVAEDLQICGGGGVMTDQGGANGLREPGRVERPRVSVGAKGGRSQGGADRSMGRDGVR